MVTTSSTSTVRAPAAEVLRAGETTARGEALGARPAVLSAACSLTQGRERGQPGTLGETAGQHYGLIEAARGPAAGAVGTGTSTVRGKPKRSRRRAPASAGRHRDGRA